MRAFRFLGGSANPAQEIFTGNLSRAVILIPILSLALAAQVPVSNRARPRSGTT